MAYNPVQIGDISVLVLRGRGQYFQVTGITDFNGVPYDFSTWTNLLAEITQMTPGPTNNPIILGSVTSPKPGILNLFLDYADTVNLQYGTAAIVILGIPAGEPYYQTAARGLMTVLPSFS